MSLRNAEDLATWLNLPVHLDNKAKNRTIRRLLSKAGISFITTLDGQPSTTDEAINNALNPTDPHSGSHRTEEINFD